MCSCVLWQTVRQRPFPNQSPGWSRWGDNWPTHPIPCLDISYRFIFPPWSSSVREACTIFLVQVVLTSSILIVVTEVWVDGPAELQNIIPLVFIQSLVLGLLWETLMGGRQWGNNPERGVKSCLKMSWFHISFIRAMRFTSRNWLKTGKSGHDLPSSRASINFAVSMSKLLWFLSWGQKQLSEWAQ